VASSQCNDLEAGTSPTDGLYEAIGVSSASRWFPGRRSADGKPVRVTENGQLRR
jgi:hypothetical protein